MKYLFTYYKYVTNLNRPNLLHGRSVNYIDDYIHRILHFFNKKSMEYSINIHKTIKIVS